MKTIKGTVISAIKGGEVAEIRVEGGKIYGINKEKRVLTDFHASLKKGDKVTLTVDPQDNRLYGIEKN